MQENSFKIIVGDSVRNLMKNLWLAIAGILLWIIINILSLISVRINYWLADIIKPESQYGPVIFGAWLVVFGIISVFFMAFIFSGLIHSAYLGFNRKIKIKDFLYGSKKYWFRVWITLIIGVLASVIVGRAAHYAALYIGMFLSLEINYARFLFIGLYILGLLGVLIFLTFASFFVVIDSLSSWKGIKKSAGFVKRHYVVVLGLCVLLFLIFYFLENVHPLIGALIEYIILLPILAVVLTRMAMEDKKLP